MSPASQDVKKPHLKRLYIYIPDGLVRHLPTSQLAGCSPTRRFLLDTRRSSPSPSATRTSTARRTPADPPSSCPKLDPRESLTTTLWTLSFRRPSWHQSTRPASTSRRGAKRGSIRRSTATRLRPPRLSRWPHSEFPSSMLETRQTRVSSTLMRTSCRLRPRLVALRQSSQRPPQTRTSPTPSRRSKSSPSPIPSSPSPFQLDSSPPPLALPLLQHHPPSSHPHLPHEARRCLLPQILLRPSSPIVNPLHSPPKCPSWTASSRPTRTIRNPTSRSSNPNPNPPRRPPPSSPPPCRPTHLSRSFLPSLVPPPLLRELPPSSPPLPRSRSAIAPRTTRRKSSRRLLARRSRSSRLGSGVLALDRLRHLRCHQRPSFPS